MKMILVQNILINAENIMSVRVISDYIYIQYKGDISDRFYYESKKAAQKAFEEIVKLLKE